MCCLKQVLQHDNSRRLKNIHYLMKTISILLAIISLTWSCDRPTSAIVDIGNAPAKQLEITKLCDIDTLNPMGLFCYNGYVFTVAPQAHLDTHPYRVFDENLNYVTQVGVFGKAKDEFFEINPLYIEKRNNAFVQCTNGYFETELTFNGKDVRILNSHKLSNRNMNNLCRLNKNIILFEDETRKKEWTLYDTEKQEAISCFGDFPNGNAPCNDFGMCLSKEERTEFYDKAIAFDTVNGNIYTFYLYIPYVKIYNTEGLERASLGLMVDKRDRDTFMRAYQQGLNPVYYSQARPYKDGVLALYHGTSYADPHSEFHLWKGSGLMQRYTIDMWVLSFDVSHDTIYCICIKDGKLNILKTKLN